MKVHPTRKFDNKAKTYEHITAVPLAAAMGAEIRGVDISTINDAQFLEVEDALYRHKMIYFRDQKFSHGDQESFTLRFGEFADDAYTTGVEGHRNVQPVIMEADTRIEMVFGNGWHVDSPFMAQPPAISMLYGVEIPPYGGDTMWANSVLAYNCLSDTMKELIAPLRVHFSANNVVNQLKKEAEEKRKAEVDDGKTQGFGVMQLDMKTQKMVDGSFHPLVRTHPKSGEKSLFIDQTYSRGFEGLTDDEAFGLLSFLKEHLAQPAFTCRLRWEPGTFVLWDNRICAHHAFNDYDGFRREMYRTTVKGETPS
ncbi:MAG: TauD/TfdA family dioxygenase [Betaproteobacteria bacterium]